MSRQHKYAQLAGDIFSKMGSPLLYLINDDDKCREHVYNHVKLLDPIANIFYNFAIKHGKFVVCRLSSRKNFLRRTKSQFGS